MKFAQSCLTLSNPMDYTVHGILESRIMEWVAFPFSRRSSQPRDQTQVSHIAGRFFQLSHKGNSYLVKYSGLENFMDYIVHGVTKNQTRLSDFHCL